MKMYKCPHCSEKSISIIGKATMNIKYRSKCKVCRMYYGPPYRYSALLLLFICVIFTIVYILKIESWVKVGISIVLVAIYYAFNILVMPIVKK